MTRKTLLLLVFVLTYLSAESQNKNVISDKEAVVHDENLNTDKKNTVHITNISVLESDSKSFIPQEKIAITENSSVKKAKTQVSSSVTLLTAKEISASKAVNRKALVKDKTLKKSTKKRVTIHNLSATPIEN